MRSQATTKQLSAALKRANSYCHADTNARIEIAYDRKTGSWFAWLQDERGNQIGLNGRATNPMDAVEELILNNTVAAVDSTMDFHPLN